MPVLSRKVECCDIARAVNVLEVYHDGTDEFFFWASTAASLPRLIPLLTIYSLNFLIVIVVCATGYSIGGEASCLGAF